MGVQLIADGEVSIDGSGMAGGIMRDLVFGEDMDSTGFGRFNTAL